MAPSKSIKRNKSSKCPSKKVLLGVQGSDVKIWHLGNRKKKRCGSSRKQKRSGSSCAKKAKQSCNKKKKAPKCKRAGSVKPPKPSCPVPPSPSMMERIMSMFGMCPPPKC